MLCVTYNVWHATCNMQRTTCYARLQNITEYTQEFWAQFANDDCTSTCWNLHIRTSKHDKIHVVMINIASFLCVCHTCDIIMTNTCGKVTSDNWQIQRETMVLLRKEPVMSHLWQNHATEVTESKRQWCHEERASHDRVIETKMFTGMSLSCYQCRWQIQWERACHVTITGESHELNGSQPSKAFTPWWSWRRLIQHSLQNLCVESIQSKNLLTLSRITMLFVRRHRAFVSF